MTRPNQKEDERNQAQHFLEQKSLGFAVESLCSYCGEASGPDVIATVLVDGTPLHVGIETTEYQTDATGDQPKARAYHTFFEAFRAKMWVLSGTDEDLLQVYGSVSFRRACGPITREASDLATDVCLFLKTRLKEIEDGGFHVFRGDGRGGTPSGFDGFRLVKKYVSHMRVWRILSRSSPAYWGYDNVACVGLNIGHVCSMIGRKAKELPSYYRTGLDETWLVICAGATLSVPDSPGPLDRAEPHLKKNEVREAASRSGFNRVYFWDASCGGWWFDLISQIGAWADGRRCL